MRVSSFRKLILKCSLLKLTLDASLTVPDVQIAHFLLILNDFLHATRRHGYNQKHFKSNSSIVCRKFSIYVEKKLFTYRKLFFHSFSRPSGVSERNGVGMRITVEVICDNRQFEFSVSIELQLSRHRSACTRQWDVKNCDNGRICLRKIDFPSSNERELRFRFRFAMFALKSQSLYLFNVLSSFFQHLMQ